MCRRYNFIFLLFFCFATLKGVQAQHSTQFWAEYQFDYPFANVYLYEATVSYQTLMTANPQSKWWSVALSNTFEYSIEPKLDLTAEIPIGYTLQKENANSFEVSPLIGARYYFSQGKRFDIRFLLRYQHRFFRTIDEDLWEKSNRVRLRGEAWISLTGPNMFTDNLWYSFLDYEEFVVVDEQVNERFANRRRLRVGIGYRLNYMHRFDLGYTWQSSRNEIGGAFISDDSVIQFKYKMYLNPSGIAASR